MSEKGGISALYKNIKSGFFMLETNNTPVGEVTKLVCKNLIETRDPLPPETIFYVELSGEIYFGKIKNDVPCLIDPFDNSKTTPIEKLTAARELPSLLEKIRIEIAVIRELTPKTMPNKKLLITLRQLELNDVVRYDDINYNRDKRAYPLNNFKIKAGKLEEKELPEKKRTNGIIWEES
jgi:hypothetical protein